MKPIERMIPVSDDSIQKILSRPGAAGERKEGSMAGLVQQLNVQSDTNENLKHALAIARSWHGHAVAYKAGSGFIELLWHAEEGSTNLPFKLDTEEKMFCFVRDWLSTAEYPKNRPDTDGSTEMGWKVTCGYDGKSWVNFYATCRIETEWIVYGK